MIKTIEFDLSAELEETKDAENLDAGSVTGDEGEAGGMYYVFRVSQQVKYVAVGAKRRRRQCDIVWTQVYQSEKDGLIYCAQCDARIRVPGMKRKVYVVCPALG